MGAVIGLLRLARVTPRESRNSWLAVGLLIYLGALAVARLGYVFEHFDYFRRHLSQTLAFWTGGFTWQAGVIGAFVVLFILSIILRKSWRMMLDITAIILLPMSVTLWLGAWTEGLAYGAAAPEGAWWGFPSQDVFGAAALHLPVQLMAALSFLLVLGIVEALTSKSKRRGVRGSLLWLAFSALMLVFTLLRTDPAPNLLTLRIETWFAILFSGVFIFLTLGLYFASIPEKANRLPLSVEELKDEQV